MNRTRALALLLALISPLTRAQTSAVDFDGLSKRPLALEDALRLAQPRRAPTPPAVPAAPEAAPAGAISFHGTTLPTVAFSDASRIPNFLVAAIDATRSRLRLALYVLNLPDVADAIVRAKRRGVDVKLIYDQSHTLSVDPAHPIEIQGSQPGTSGGASPQYHQVVKAGVETRILRGTGPYGIMHNKFVICDGELVETGSFNWTTSADQANFENALFRDDASLAALYSSYFDYMWNYARPADAPTLEAEAAAPTPEKFSPPPSDPAPSVQYKGRTLPRAVFSPNGGTEALLVASIGRATKSVDVAMYSFYSPLIASALAAAKNRGVAVRFVGDVGQSRRSPQVADLITHQVSLRLSGGRGGKGVLHHKFALFDGELVATGSFNYSENAEQNSFENDFFSADAGDLAAFQAEFETVWAQAHVPAPGELGGAVRAGAEPVAAF